MIKTRGRGEEFCLRSSFFVLKFLFIDFIMFFVIFYIIIFFYLDFFRVEIFDGIIELLKKYIL